MSTCHGGQGIVGTVHCSRGLSRVPAIQRVSRKNRDKWVSCQMAATRPFDILGITPKFKFEIQRKSKFISFYVLLLHYK
jgi:hypothetical protein